jgi:hypothetical protein
MRSVEPGSGRPFVKVNHPAAGDIVGNPTHVAGYGTGFEGVVAVKVLDDDGTELASEGFQTSEGMGRIGEFFGNVRLRERPATQIGVIEAWASSGQENARPGLVRVPIVFDADIIRR